MKKSELLRALQFEIQKHNLSTFMDEKDKVVITGCTMCRKHFGTVEQFKRHITDDVLRPCSISYRVGSAGVCATALLNDYKNNAWINFPGSIPIHRVVNFVSTGIYSYTITKSGSSAILNPIP